MGDKVSATKTLLTFRGFHAGHASTRAPATTKTRVKMRMPMVMGRRPMRHFGEIGVYPLAFLLGSLRMAILMMTRVRMRTVLSPPGAPLFCSLKLLDRETSLQVCNVLLKIDQSLKKILKTRSKSK